MTIPGGGLQGLLTVGVNREHDHEDGLLLLLLDEDIKGDSQYPRQCVTAPIRARVRPRKYRESCKRDGGWWISEKEISSYSCWFKLLLIFELLSLFFPKRSMRYEDGDFLATDGKRVTNFSTKYSDR